MITKIIRLLLGKSRSPAEPLIHQIVERSLAEVCQQVKGRLAEMSLSEARGYVRARATQIVLRETRLAIANSVEVDLSAMADLARQATERLIPQVIRQTYSAGQHPQRAAA